MPKTRNAFAFRDFDEKRILQRPYFRQFGFDADKTDEEIVNSLQAADDDSIDALEKKLTEVKCTHVVLGVFRRRIRKHYAGRCDRYNRKKAEAEGVKISELKRFAGTIKYFTAELEVVELMNKYSNLYHELEKIIERRYRKRLGARLKQLRQEAGLTQKELGDLIQISQDSYGLYERGERDPSTPTIFRLLRIFPKLFVKK